MINEQKTVRLFDVTTSQKQKKNRLPVYAHLCPKSSTTPNKIYPFHYLLL